MKLSIDTQTGETEITKMILKFLKAQQKPMNSGKKNVSAFYSRSWKLTYQLPQYEPPFFLKDNLQKKSPSESYNVCYISHFVYSNYEFDGWEMVPI